MNLAISKVPLCLFQKLTGSMEPVEPVLTTALHHNSSIGCKTARSQSLRSEKKDEKRGQRHNQQKNEAATPIFSDLKC